MSDSGNDNADDLPQVAARVGDDGAAVAGQALQRALGADEGFTMWPAQYGWAVNRRAQIRTLNHDDAAAQKK
jgi:hypothetical protein